MSNVDPEEIPYLSRMTRKILKFMEILLLLQESDRTICTFGQIDPISGVNQQIFERIESKSEMLDISNENGKFCSLNEYFDCNINDQPHVNGHQNIMNFGLFISTLTLLILKNIAPNILEGLLSSENKGITISLVRLNSNSTPDDVTDSSISLQGPRLAHILNLFELKCADSVYAIPIVLGITSNLLLNYVHIYYQSNRTLDKPHSSLSKQHQKNASKASYSCVVLCLNTIKSLRHLALSYDESNTMKYLFKVCQGFSRIKDATAPFKTSLCVLLVIRVVMPLYQSSLEISDILIKLLLQVLKISPINMEMFGIDNIYSIIRSKSINNNIPTTTAAVLLDTIRDNISMNFSMDSTLSMTPSNKHLSNKRKRGDWEDVELLTVDPIIEQGPSIQETGVVPVSRDKVDGHERTRQSSRQYNNNVPNSTVESIMKRYLEVSTSPSPMTNESRTHCLDNFYLKLYYFISDAETQCTGHQGSTASLRQSLPVCVFRSTMDWLDGYLQYLSVNNRHKVQLSYLSPVWATETSNQKNQSKRRSCDKHGTYLDKSSVLGGQKWLSLQMLLVVVASIEENGFDTLIRSLFLRFDASIDKLLSVHRQTPLGGDIDTTNASRMKADGLLASYDVLMTYQVLIAILSHCRAINPLVLTSSIENIYDIAAVLIEEYQQQSHARDCFDTLLLSSIRILIAGLAYILIHQSRTSLKIIRGSQSCHQRLCLLFDNDMHIADASILTFIHPMVAVYLCVYSLPMIGIQIQFNNIRRMYHMIYEGTDGDFVKQSMMAYNSTDFHEIDLTAIASISPAMKEPLTAFLCQWDPDVRGSCIDDFPRNQLINVHSSSMKAMGGLLYEYIQGQVMRQMSVSRGTSTTRTSTTRTSTTPRRGRNTTTGFHLLNLPLDVIQSILPYFSLKRVQRLAATCKLLHALIMTNQTLWKELYLNIFPECRPYLDRLKGRKDWLKLSKSRYLACARLRGMSRLEEGFVPYACPVIGCDFLIRRQDAASKHMDTHIVVVKPRYWYK